MLPALVFPRGTALKPHKLSSADNMKDCVTFGSQTVGHREPLPKLWVKFISAQTKLNENQILPST